MNGANNDYDYASQKLSEVDRRIEEKLFERNLLLETDIDRGIRNTENEIKKLKTSLDYLNIKSLTD